MRIPLLLATLSLTLAACGSAMVEHPGKQAGITTELAPLGGRGGIDSNPAGSDEGNSAVSRLDAGAGKASGG